MKATILSVFATSTALAQTAVRTTNNECFKAEGGRYVQPCSDVYFLTCDVYEVFPDEKCNVYTFSDSRLVPESSEIEIFYWDYYLRAELEGDIEYTGADFGEQESDALCYPSTSMPR